MVNISSVFENSAAYHQWVRDGSVRRSVDQNSRKHAEDADVIRTIATRILESTADLLAQLWSTFDIVDRCISQACEYMDLLWLSENGTNSARSLLPTLRSRCGSSFADTTEYDYEPAHIGGVTMSVHLDAVLLHAIGIEPRRPTPLPFASTATALCGLNGRPHPTLCPTNELNGWLAALAGNGQPRAEGFCNEVSAVDGESYGRHWINSRTVELRSAISRHCG